MCPALFSRGFQTVLHSKPKSLKEVSTLVNSLRARFCINFILFVLTQNRNDCCFIFAHMLNYSYENGETLIDGKSSLFVKLQPRAQGEKRRFPGRSSHAAAVYNRLPGLTDGDGCFLTGEFGEDYV